MKSVREQSEWWPNHGSKKSNVATAAKLYTSIEISDQAKKGKGSAVLVTARVTWLEASKWFGKPNIGGGSRDDIEE